MTFKYDYVLEVHCLGHCTCRLGMELYILNFQECDWTEKISAVFGVGTECVNFHSSHLSSFFFIANNLKDNILNGSSENQCRFKESAWTLLIY